MAGNAAGALPPVLPDVLDGVEGGEVVPKARAKQSYAAFINGEEFVTIDGKDIGQRVADATLMVRVGEPDRRVLFGIGAPFVSVVTGQKLKEYASDVMMAQAAGITKENATNTVQLLWGLGALDRLADARVMKDDGLLSKAIMGEWNKFRLDELSLRDFAHTGRYAVSRAALVDYSFVRQLRDSLGGLELVVSAVFSQRMGGFTSVLSARLEATYLGLASSTQLLVFTSVNDCLADVFKEVRTSVKGVAGASLNGPERVKELLETSLARVQLPNLAGGPAQVDMFNKLRGDMYILVAKENKAASASGGGGGAAKESGGGTATMAKGVGNGGGGGGKPVVDAKVECMDTLRNSLHLKNNSGGPVQACKNGKCRFEHTALFRLTKQAWKEEVDRSVGPKVQNEEWVKAIKTAIDAHPRIKD